jgi:hypothetical protein
VETGIRFLVKQAAPGLDKFHEARDSLFVM